MLSFDPDDTRRRHAVEALPTTLRDPRTLGMAVAWADLVISGGGSMLHEADFALYGRHFLFRAGKLRPIPFPGHSGDCPHDGQTGYVVCAGPWALHTRSARVAVRVLGSASQVVAWRDREAAALAADVGVRSGVQMVVPDPAYALAPCSQERAREVLARGRCWSTGG